MPFQPDYDVPEARLPYTLEPDRSHHIAGPRVGVLYMHGFMGSPISSRPLAEYLCERGVFVHCPLLPGHGHYPDKLRDATREAWLAEAEEAYRYARKRVDRLLLIGHSMGNVLNARLVTRFGGEGMVMLAPVYDVPDNRLRYVKYARHFMPWYYPHKSKRPSMQQLVRERVLDFDPTIDFDDPEFQAQLPELSRVPLSGMHEMVATIEYGRRLWPKLDLPVRIFAGGHDVAAPPANAQRIFSLLKVPDKEITVYPEAGHELMRPQDPAHELLWPRILEFIEERSGEAAL